MATHPRSACFVLNLPLTSRDYQTCAVHRGAAPSNEMRREPFVRDRKLKQDAGATETPQPKEIIMNRMLIIAAAFAALWLGTVNAASAQGTPLQPLDQAAPQAPGDDVQGAPTDEVKEGEVQSSERLWVWINSCWSRWHFVGYSGSGYPLYRRYVVCY